MQTLAERLAAIPGALEALQRPGAFFVKAGSVYTAKRVDGGWQLDPLDGSDPVLVSDDYAYCSCEQRTAEEHCPHTLALQFGSRWDS